MFIKYIITNDFCRVKSRFMQLVMLQNVKVVVGWAVLYWLLWVLSINYGFHEKSMMNLVLLLFTENVKSQNIYWSKNKKKEKKKKKKKRRYVTI